MTQSKKNMSGVVKRHIIAALFLPVFIAYLYYLPPMPYFMALLLVVGITALWEFYAMYRVPARLSLPGVLLGGLLLYLACIYRSFLPEGLFISLCVLMLISLFARRDPSGCMTEMGPLVTGLFYVGIFLSFQWSLRLEDLGREYVFMLYTCVWLADAGAFYIGTYMGRNKLYPSVSPNKTWEGAYGSLIGGALGAVIITKIFNMPVSLTAAAATGAVMGVTALLGDLVESMFKRDAGVKDSGVFIPGHGGMLDKLDGMLVSGPVLYLIVRYI
ncbi:MAG: phosphatidate cytidylyltransferase [Nitrospirota bacterium]